METRAAHEHTKKVVKLKPRFDKDEDSHIGLKGVVIGWASDTPRDPTVEVQLSSRKIITWKSKRYDVLEEDLFATKFF